MQRTLGTLLAIARAEAAGVTTHGDDVDLAALAANMVELYAPGMRAAGLEVTLEAPDPRAAHRQPATAGATHHQPAGERAQVRARGRPRAGCACENRPDGIALSVADNGPGIAAADRAAALRPFVRVGDAASKAAGSGLGLSVSRPPWRGCTARRLTLGDNSPGTDRALRVSRRLRLRPGATSPGGVAQVS